MPPAIPTVRHDETETATTPLISIRGVTRLLDSGGAFTALSDVSLSVARGGFVVILGESAAEIDAARSTVGS